MPSRRRSTTLPASSSTARRARSCRRSFAGSSRTVRALGCLGDGEGLAASRAHDHELLFWRAEQLLAARAGKLAGGAFLSQAIVRHRLGNRAEVDRRAATLGTAIERGIDHLIVEVPPGAVDEDGRVPELELVRAAPVRTCE